MTETAAPPSVAGLAPLLTPRGRLRVAAAEDAPALAPEVRQRLEDAFGRGAGHGLLQLGAGEVGTALPAALGYWREMGALFVTTLCTSRPASEGRRVDLPPAPMEDLRALAAAPPPMTGAEYLTAPVLETLWKEMGVAFQEELENSGASVQDLLKRWSPAWNLVGRVHFHLAENRKDEESPFARAALPSAQGRSRGTHRARGSGPPSRPEGPGGREGPRDEGTLRDLRNRTRRGVRAGGAGKREAGATTPLPRAEAKEEGGCSHRSRNRRTRYLPTRSGPSTPFLLSSSLHPHFWVSGPPPQAFAETSAGCRPT
jgi:hypothetical protein